MNKTVVPAELPMELLNLARDFVQRSGLTNFNDLLAEALRDYLTHHGAEAPNLGTQADRQKVFQSLAELSESCAKPCWDGRDSAPVCVDTFRYAYRFVESLPPGFPMPVVGAEPNGELTMEWQHSPERLLSLGVNSEGRLLYVALLGSIGHRSGIDYFQGSAPVDMLRLIREVLAG